MRWIHIVSVVTLIGGYIYARFALAPAIASAAPADSNRFMAAVQSAFATAIHRDRDRADLRDLQLRNKRELSARVSHVDGHQAAAGAAHPLVGDFGFHAGAVSGEEQPHGAVDCDHGADDNRDRELFEVHLTR